MKNVYTLLALAASLGEVYAGFGSKGGSFNCPDNTNNKCPPKLVPGFDWSDLPTGSFSNYGGFQWSGWSCASNFGKRGEEIFNPVLPRTGGKAITGSCSPQKEKSPSFGCGFAGSEIDAFSVVTFSIVPEFSCDLEFHFGMSDGSTCKQRSHCDKSGSTVKNTQCGGAKNVTVVYPSQPTMPKSTCSVGIHSMSFDCSSSKTTVPPKTTTLSTSVRTTSTTKTTTTPIAVTTTTKATSTATSTSTTSTSTSTASSAPVETTTSSAAVSTPPTTSTTSTSTTTSEVQFTTSTVFTTIVSTVTSCGPEVTSCPGRSTVLTTVTVALSTTICPVTEATSTTLAVSTKPTTTSTTSTTLVSIPSSSAVVVVTTTKSTSAAPPVQTLPCPEVLPTCINTWLFSVGCSSNTDSGCYCPDEIFVQNIFSCVYAYGQTDEIVSQAVVFFQGICAPYVPQNPAIATGAATVTTVLTVTATPSVQATYTTVVVTATTVVPCSTNGSVIPGSSTTSVYTNSLTVPQVGFTTQTSGSVGIVPVTSVVVATTAAATTTTKGAAAGTGSLTTTTGAAQFTGAANRVGSGFGLGLAVLAAVAAL